jgi:hypothetical protein
MWRLRGRKIPNGSKNFDPNPIREPCLERADERSRAQFAKIKQKIEANSDYVGMNFAHEARAMHSGESPNRAIYGEAKAEEAKALIDEGIPVAPLPFVPKRQTN